MSPNFNRTLSPKKNWTLAESPKILLKSNELINRNSTESPSKFNELNPNFVIKRKYTDLPQPKNLSINFTNNFKKDFKNTNLSITNFMTKRFKDN